MNEVWLVSGANRGLGLEFARQLLERGDHVIATAREPDKANELGILGNQFPEALQIEELDVGDPSSIAALTAKLAGQKIDVLLNNAGLYGGCWETDADRQTTQGMDYELWEYIHKINVMGPFRLTVALFENLMLSERRLVVNMSSELGSIEINTMGHSHAYRSSKSALNMVTKGLSIDLAENNITVFSMAPGWVKTDLGGSSALWEPSESIKKQLQVIDKITIKDSGRFINLKGEKVAW